VRVSTWPQKRLTMSRQSPQVTVSYHWPRDNGTVIATSHVCFYALEQLLVCMCVSGRSATTKSRGISGVSKSVTGERDGRQVKAVEQLEQARSILEQGLAIMNTARASTVSLGSADSVTDAGRVKVSTVKL
jgi:hypothetical protein